MANDQNDIPSFLKSTIIDKEFVFSQVSEKRKKELKTESLFVVYDSTNHIRVMKHFHSPIENIEEEGVEAEIQNAWKIDGQNDFYVRMYLPKKSVSGRTSEDKNNHVIIMFNGLNEFENYYMYDTLGSNFANEGYASILLPTPYHLNRRIMRPNKRKAWKPSEYVNSKGYDMMYYYNYKKSILELAELISLVRGKKKDTTDHGMAFYKNYFNGEKTKITLFGFSLGGVKALGGMLNLFRDETPIHSCIIFNGAIGLELSDLTKIDNHPGEIIDSLKITREGVRQLSKHPIESQRRLALLYQWMCFTPEELCSIQSFKYLTKDEKDCFNQLLADILSKDVEKVKGKQFSIDVSDSLRIMNEGIIKISSNSSDTSESCIQMIHRWTSFIINKIPKNKNEMYKGLEEDLAKISSRCLFIQSGGDSAVSTSMLNNIVPEGGLHQIIIPGAEHNLEADAIWGDWLPKVTQYMSNFLADEQTISQQEILTEFYDLLEGTTVFNIMVEFKQKIEGLEKDILKESAKMNDETKNLTDAEKEKINMLIDGYENQKLIAREESPLFNKLFSLESIKSLEDEIVKKEEQKGGKIRSTRLKTSSDIKTRFYQLYFASKAYFPKFPELLEQLWIVHSEKERRARIARRQDRLPT